MSGVSTPFHRVRVLIRAKSRIELHVHHAGLVHALLAAAHGRSLGRPSVLPDGVMPDAPEQGRTLIRPREPFAFGFTLLSHDPAEVRAVVGGLRAGLEDLARSKPDRPLALAGNFEIEEMRDLVANRPLGRKQAPLSLSMKALELEAERALQAKQVTLRFTTPLRMTRPRPLRAPKRECFDAEYFDPGLFVYRTMRRLHELGIWAEPSDADYQRSKVIRLLANRLVWMDFTYGSRERDKILAGAMGRVVLEDLAPDQVHALVRGQYARVGQATRFGQGAYRIEEAGPEAAACTRSLSLVDLALDQFDLDEAAQTYELPAGTLRRAAKTLRGGRYTPKGTFRLPITQADGRQRTLSIPTRLDRGLQRAILATLGPAIDTLLEEASIAYRRGLGREAAAKRVRQAFEQGYRYGLRADFRRFFDSIDHRVLRDRLDAYLADDRMVDLLMAWIRSGSPLPEVGVPTGAPISPLVSNLLLDQFDEEVAAEGGLLVRYADDFVILYRSREEAERVFTVATDAAKALELALNASKTRHVELGAFEFLGYRFECRDRWVACPTGEPRAISELGWRESVRAAPDAPPWPLPGEGEPVSGEERSWVVVGPGISQIRATGPHLECAYGDGRETRVSLERVQELVILGRPTLTGSALDRLLADSRRILLSDDRARVTGSITRDEGHEDPAAIAAQVDLSRDPLWRLGLARRILSAKIANYAALADAVCGTTAAAAGSASAGGAPSGQRAGPAGAPMVTPLGAALRSLAHRALTAESLETLFGVEGAAAARWYGALGGYLPEWCRFQRRVAPDAEDPGNVMLNMAMTALHRQIVLAIRMAGLVPTLGIFHAAKPGHACLASDLQEPFRPLMDRVVLQVARAIKPTDFVRERGGEHSLRLSPSAVRKLAAAVYGVFALPCRSAGGTEVLTYRTHMLLAARTLRRHLLDRSVKPHVLRFETKESVAGTAGAAAGDSGASGASGASGGFEGSAATEAAGRSETGAVEAASDAPPETHQPPLQEPEP